MTVLITGSAGFIGSHCAEAFVQAGHRVIGLDNFDAYYDPRIKHRTAAMLADTYQVKTYTGDCRDTAFLVKCIQDNRVTSVIHLAALAGVRNSLETPQAYYSVNVMGTLSVCEAARQTGIQKILLASSSSVYGNNKQIPFAETHAVDHPISPYAASKKATELLAYSYYHLYQLPIACLRFFTVYGPRQRPEMAIHRFARAIQAGERIPVYNQGLCERDYTYSHDITAGIMAVWSAAFKYDIINLGSGTVVSTLTMIQTLEKYLNKPAYCDLLPAQPGDVDRTYASLAHAKAVYGYTPQVTLDAGIARFVETL